MVNPPPVNSPVDDPAPANGPTRPNKIWVAWFQQVTAALNTLITVLSNLTSAMIRGTTTNDNAPVGYIGEYPTPANLTGVALVTATVINVSSASLSAGDYEVTGTVRFNPAASSTINQVVAGVSLVANSVGGSGTFTQLVSTFSTGQTQTISAPLQRISLAAPSTVYLVAALGFAVSTATANGYLHVRRVR